MSGADTSVRTPAATPEPAVPGPDGSHHLHVACDTLHPAIPYVVRAEAEVKDVNRQAHNAQTSFLVLPASRFVGLRSKNLVLGENRRTALDALVCNIDGRVEPGVPIQFRAARREWKLKEKQWQILEADAVNWNARSGAHPIRVTFTPPTPGEWCIRATVRDSRGRPSLSERTFWAPGGNGSTGDTIGA